MQAQFGWRMVLAAAGLGAVAAYGAFRFLADLLGLSQDFSAFRAALARVHSLAAKWPVATFVFGVVVGIGASYWWRSANVAASIDRWWYRAKFFGIALRADDLISMSAIGDTIGLSGIASIQVRNAGFRPVTIHAAHVFNEYGEMRQARRNIDGSILELVDPTVLKPNEEAHLVAYLETAEGVDPKNLGLSSGFNQWADAKFVIDTSIGKIERHANPEAVIDLITRNLRSFLLFGLKSHREAVIWEIANQQRLSAINARKQRPAPPKNG